MSYVNDHFDELAAKFVEPESRTAERLRPVYSATLDATILAKQRADELFADPTDPRWDSSVRESWERDFSGLLERLGQVYAPELVPEGVPPAELSTWGSMDKDALALKSYAGLIQRRELSHPDGLGAGPVPDAAMPAFLLEQLAIVDAHGEEIGQKWLDDMKNAIPDFVRRAKDKAGELVDDATDFGRSAVSIAVIAVLGFLAYKVWDRYG